MISPTQKHACCTGGHGRGLGRIRFGAGIVGPSGALLLIPKCPLCIAAYVAAFTGLGLSVGTAAGIRLALIMLCLLAIGFFGYRIASGPKRDH
jgi:hypothetical protein